MLQSIKVALIALYVKVKWMEYKKKKNFKSYNYTFLIHFNRVFKCDAQVFYHYS